MTTTYDLHQHLWPKAFVTALRARAEELLQEFTAPDGSLSVPGIARVVVATPAPGGR